MNYVVANRVYVKQEYSQEFEQRFKDRAGQIDKQRGFRGEFVEKAATPIRDLHGDRG